MDYSTLTNTELIPLLDLPEEVDGLRYYMPKALKIAWLDGSLDDDGKEKALAVAKKAQSDHHAYLRTRRKDGPVDRGKAIETLFAGDRWRYVRHDRTARGFRDQATHRKASVAYVLERVGDGKRVMVTRSTVDHVHETLGNIEGWPLPRGRRKVAKEAKAAGMPTLSDLR